MLSPQDVVCARVWLPFKENLSQLKLEHVCGILSSSLTRAKIVPVVETDPSTDAKKN